MAIHIILLLAGLALIVFGADYLVDGASSIARRSGLSEFVIGLTIVGMGTSAPEMVVSFIGAAHGNADIAVGNVVGSNIFNTLLILGLTALILPMPVTRENRRRDIPLNLFVTLILVLLGMKFTLFGIGEDGLSRLEGVLLIALFALYMWLSFRSGKSGSEASSSSSAAGDEVSENAPVKSLPLSIVMVIGGLAALIVGGNFFVDSATWIASALGVSDKFIAITILAGGTSMPELATCIVAAAKKRGQLALGNILGSNMFNILLILGGSAIIHPLSFGGMNLVDTGALLASAVLVVFALVFGKKNYIDRADGALLLATWIAYMTYLIINL